MAGWRRMAVRAGALVLAALLVLAGVGGCSLAPPTIVQGGGLPTLHHRDWGFGTLSNALWSPNGRWIAVQAGPDFAGSHFEVVSPDGRARYDLSRWGCGPVAAFDYAWLPDNRLSCFSTETGRICIGAAPFTSCRAVPLPDSIAVEDDGAVWAPDGSYLLIAAVTQDLQAGTAMDNPDLQAVTPSGMLTQVLPFSAVGGIYLPAWVPHAPATLSYVLDSKLDVSVVTHDQHGLVLGPPQMLAHDLYLEVDRYAWSPSGRWVAVRYGDYRGGDKIYLVNASQPSQTVDVVLADKVGQQMADPIWSPDGKTMIVFGVNDEQPYALDIAAYLQGKGLQV